MLRAPGAGRTVRPGALEREVMIALRTVLTLCWQSE
jgi:hypothetical protein